MLTALVLPALLWGCADKPASRRASTGSPSATTKPPTTTTSAPTTAVTKTLPGGQVSGRGAFLGPLRSVEVDAVPVAFRQFGHGPDLVLVSGQGSPMSEWPVTMLARLAKTHRVTIYDNRGLGSTGDVSSKPLTMEQMGDDLAGVTRALGLRQPRIFGWSTGGEIALVAAVRHPGLLGPMLVSGAEPGGRLSRDAAPAIIAKFEDPATPPLDLIGLLFAPSATKARDQFLADLGAVPQSSVSPATTRRYADAEHAYLRGHDYGPDLRRLKGRVTVTDGVGDQLVPIANAKTIASLVPGARLSLHPGGHAWFMEHPDLLDQDLASL